MCLTSFFSAFFSSFIVFFDSPWNRLSMASFVWCVHNQIKRIPQFIRIQKANNDQLEKKAGLNFTFHTFVRRKRKKFLMSAFISHFKIFRISRRRKWYFYQFFLLFFFDYGLYDCVRVCGIKIFKVQSPAKNANGTHNMEDTHNNNVKKKQHPNNYIFIYKIYVRYEIPWNIMFTIYGNNHNNTIQKKTKPNAQRKKSEEKTNS